MSSIVPVTGKMGTTSPTDTYPLMEDVDLQGGWRVVADINAMNAIPAERRKEGMEVKVGDKTFELRNGQFVEKQNGGGSNDWDSIQNKPPWINYIPNDSLSGNENKVLSVKPDGNGYEYSDKLGISSSSGQVIENRDGSLMGSNYMYYNPISGGQMYTILIGRSDNTPPFMIPSDNGFIRTYNTQNISENTIPISGNITGIVNPNTLEDSTKSFVINSLVGKFVLFTSGKRMDTVTKIRSNTATTISFYEGGVDEFNTVGETYKIIPAKQIVTNTQGGIYPGFILISSTSQPFVIDFKDSFPSGDFIFEIGDSAYGYELTANSPRIYIYGCQFVFPEADQVMFKPFTKYVISNYFEGGHSSEISNFNNIEYVLPVGSEFKFDASIKVYKMNISSNTNIKIHKPSNNVLLTNKMLTIEIHINMTVASNITWPNNITWIGGHVPLLSSIGNYCIALRTLNGGASWIANLAYTY